MARSPTTPKPMSLKQGRLRKDGAMPFPTYQTYTNIPGISNGAGFKPHNSASLWVFDNPISATTTAGIYDTAEYNLNTFQVNANITSQTKSGIDLVGAQNTVKIGQNREVDGAVHAVRMAGDHSELINNGILKGTDKSVEIIGGSYAGFTNYGTVKSDVYLEGKDISVALGANSFLEETLTIASAAGGAATIVNEGSMTSLMNGKTFSGGAGNETLINKGTIKGWAIFSEGKNIFINQGGP